MEKTFVNLLLVKQWMKRYTKVAMPKSRFNRSGSPASLRRIRLDMSDMDSENWAGIAYLVIQIRWYDVRKSIPNMCRVPLSRNIWWSQTEVSKGLKSYTYMTNNHSLILTLKFQFEDFIMWKRQIWSFLANLFTTFPQDIMRVIESMWLYFSHALVMCCSNLSVQRTTN